MYRHSGHGHGHGRVHFDHLESFRSHGRGTRAEHGHAGHTSVEGYPFVHSIGESEIDFVERALELDLGFVDGADGGAANELEFESELVWALNSRFVFIAGAPLVSINSMFDENTTGYGDLELGLQWLAYNGRRSMLFTGLFMTVPTGDNDRDLGAGSTILEPTVLWLQDFGCGNYMQGRFSVTVPVANDPIGNEFNYNIALFHTFTQTDGWQFFRFLTPIVEANGVTTLNGASQGDTSVHMTTGLRWIVREMDEVGFGWSLPITGDRLFESRYLLSYRWHF